MSDRKTLRLSSVAAIALTPFVIAGVANAQGYTPSPAKGDWPMYFAEPSGSRYSPSGSDRRFQLQQAGACLALQDRQRWAPIRNTSWKAPRSRVNGMVYTTAGSRRAVVALDAKTGELKWVYSMNEGLRAADRAAPALRPRRLLLDRRQWR
jgi:quinoprotein glucose dehydrogenase